MTNNIEKIKKQICPPPSLNGVRRLILKGETDKAKEALTDALISDIENCNTTNCTSVKKIKDVYKLLFDKLGFEFPEEIDKIVSYSHYRSIL
ncbi:MAG: hypothetical protein LBR26_07250 [Prevotella sp.]|nr:hypothetical protein [Prevotella sp.]